MMTNICLSVSEISEITNRTRPSAQIRALRELKIEAKLRPDNTVLVYRRHLPATVRERKDDRLETPDFDALVAHITHVA